VRGVAAVWPILFSHLPGVETCARRRVGERADHLVRAEVDVVVKQHHVERRGVAAGPVQEGLRLAHQPVVRVRHRHRVVQEEVLPPRRPGPVTQGHNIFISMVCVFSSLERPRSAGPTPLGPCSAPKARARNVRSTGAMGRDGGVVRRGDPLTLKARASVCSADRSCWSVTFPMRNQAHASLLEHGADRDMPRLTSLAWVAYLMLAIHVSLIAWRYLNALAELFTPIATTGGAPTHTSPLLTPS
jgi:hypothetical protein